MASGAEVEQRVFNIKEMDEIIKDKIDNDIITRWRIMSGIPDRADENDYCKIAENDELWLNVVKEFDACCALAENLKMKGTIRKMNESKLIVLVDNLKNKSYIFALNESQIRLLDFLSKEDILNGGRYHYFEDVKDVVVKV